MLRPGEQRTVSLSLDRASAQHLFDIFDQSRSRWRSPAGSYTVQVGSSSRDLRLEARIALR